eukprot:scaffold895_cov315-Pinguiococcus_pyrenoidosus.AAC.20
MRVPVPPPRFLYRHGFPHTFAHSDFSIGAAAWHTFALLRPGCEASQIPGERGGAWCSQGGNAVTSGGPWDSDSNNESPARVATAHGLSLSVGWCHELP